MLVVAAAAAAVVEEYRYWWEIFNITQSCTRYLIILSENGQASSGMHPANPKDEDPKNLAGMILNDILHVKRTEVSNPR